MYPLSFPRLTFSCISLSRIPRDTAHLTYLMNRLALFTLLTQYLRYNIANKHHRIHLPSIQRLSPSTVPLEKAYP